MKDYQSDCATKTKTILPKMSKVVMLNDDFTTMDFVVEILMTIFDKTREQANDIMLTIHTQGQAICGIYPYDIAQAKVSKAKKIIKEAGFPLRILLEE